MTDPQVVPTRRKRLLALLLGGVVGVIVLTTGLAMALLWPSSDAVAERVYEQSDSGTIVSARVVEISEQECHTAGAGGMGPGGSGAGTAAEEQGPAAGESAQGEVGSGDSPAAADAETCAEVRAELKLGKPVTFTLGDTGAGLQTVREGDTVKLIVYEVGEGANATEIYAFYDHPRGGKMIVIALLFVVIVIAVGRLRGALALIGVGAAVLLLAVFVLPAILAGESPVLVAVTGATGIMVIVLYLAHGISHRTTAALLGSIFGILFTAGAGFAVTRWLRFTGIASVEDGSLLMAVPDLRMNDILTATIVIAGLGVLNDITVAQASAVWEMRLLNPGLSKRRIYASAMRVGRDHIASSIYTLVFAYAGSMLVVLLLLYTYPRDLLQLITSEQIGQEVIRTLIGAAGLVLSMPVTTAFAVLFASDATQSGFSGHGHLHGHLHGHSHGYGHGHALAGGGGAAVGGAGDGAAAQGRVAGASGVNADSADPTDSAVHDSWGTAAGNPGDGIIGMGGQDGMDGRGGRGGRL